VFALVLTGPPGSGKTSVMEALTDARLSPVIAGLDEVALSLTTEGDRPAAVAERIRDAWPANLRPDGT
jgi:dephospho-CoA kinase